MNFLKGEYMWNKFMKKCKQMFEADEKSEPFADKEYAKETKRIYKFLAEGVGDLDNPTDKAIFDIVNQIFHELEKKKVYEPKEDKMKQIIKENIDDIICMIGNKLDEICKKNKLKYKGDKNQEKMFATFFECFDEWQEET